MARPTKNERVAKSLEGYNERQTERRGKQLATQAHSEEQPARNIVPWKNPQPTEEELHAFEVETKALFPLGTRVQFSETGKARYKHQYPDRPGKVVGYAYGGDFRLGFTALVNIIVHWDGVKKPSAGYYRDNLEVVK